VNNVGLLIFGYPHVEWNDKKKGDFKVATVFGDIPLICFHTIPSYAFSQIEHDIEFVLEHELLGLLLEEIESGLHHKFDALFPYIPDLKLLKAKEKRR